MPSSSTVVSLRQPDEVEDPLTAVLRSGARRLLAQAIEAEAETFLAAMKDAQLPGGRDRVVRHGLGPERLVQTGIGAVEVRARAPSASVSARRSCPDGHGGHEAWMRCCRSSICAASRWATSKEALGALLGCQAPNLSPSVIARLRGESEADHGRWQHRDLSARRWSLPSGGRRPTRGSTSGPTASTCRRGRSRRPSACWC